ncbi:xaa-Pro aminopeptidase ApepP-like [Paramacrobiotus metropolitanus]|uniref:xaa-Pro aminopeptidase ApepP-like n=1 Tax=Paramacrobiotus metropolitanus TaxID=2943436 RepID=UPI002445E219|nr:xaa-Pro aminopeptidase ApepP-like [Paramacrobiotus metropolitanus]
MRSAHCMLLSGFIYRAVGSHLSRSLKRQFSFFHQPCGRSPCARIPLFALYLPGPSSKSSPDSYCSRNSLSSALLRNSRAYSTMPKLNTTDRLYQLRQVMKNVTVVPEVLAAYIIPTDDAHQNEYIGPSDQRRSYISGFTGSAGTAVVTEHKAALWTDGRYFLQAADQLDENWVLVKDRLPDTPSLGKWLNEHTPVQSAVGADPTTMSDSTWDTVAKELESQERRLVPIPMNLIDFVWENRPRPSNNTACVLPLKYAGKDWRQKVLEVREKMTEKRADFLVVTALDEIAWLLNLRGADIPYNPVFFSYVIVGFDAVRLFVQEFKVTQSVLEHFQTKMEHGQVHLHDNRIFQQPTTGLGFGVLEHLSDKNSMDTDMELVILPYDQMFSELDKIVHQNASKKVWVAPESSHAVFSKIPAKQLIRTASPITLMKAIKNSVELEGMVSCHIRDGIALAEFFAWMEKEVPKGTVSELSAAAKLEEFRSAQENYISLSFDTIAASGPNGAVIHYKPTPETNRVVSVNDMFLLDSGSQYLDGTTDVTRTMHFGTPSEYQKECYTRVLKGNLALAMTKFPEKTTGIRLDTLARHALWQVGLDYGHGTGHGVGSFLNVHEGPMSISFRHNPNDPGLVAAMVVTDEPGYYEAGAFGIRIEDQLVVEQAAMTYGNATFLGFRVLTMVPLQRKLLRPDLLTPVEIERINKYHEYCMQHVGRALQDAGKTEAYRWLQNQCVPIG